MEQIEKYKQGRFNDAVNGIPRVRKSKEWFCNGMDQKEAMSNYLYALRNFIEKLPLTSEVKRKKLLKEKANIEEFLINWI